MDSHHQQPDPRPSLVRRLWGALRRLAVLALLAAAVFVAAKYYCIDRLNEEIRLRLERQLAAHYQGLTVRIQSARRMEGQGVELRGIEIRDGQQADAPLLVEIDEVFAECDTRLPDFITRTPHITRLDLRRLRLRAQRQPDGFWNLSRLLPLPSMGGGPPPRATISDGSLEIIDAAHEQSAPLALRNIELVVEPEASGKRELPDVAADAPTEIHGEADTSRSPGSAGAWPSQVAASRSLLRVRGSLAGDHLERVEIDGLLDPARAEWEIRGAVEGLEFNPRMRTALPREIAELLKPLSTVRGRTYLGFHVKRGGEAASAVRKHPDGIASAPMEDHRDADAARPPAIDFLVTGKISEGRIDDARLPEPLSDVEATIRADNDGLTIRDLSARCGATQLKVDADLRGYTATSPLVLDIEARHLALDRLPIESLPPAVGRVFDDFAPSGLVDLTAHLHFDGHSWKPTLQITCHNLAVKYHRFPCPAGGGTGTITLRDDRLGVRLRLVAGGQYVQCRADVHHPGPDFTGWVELQSEGPLPIDPKLLEALEPKFQRIVRAFHPRGSISFQGRLQRGTSDQQIHRQLQITLHECSIQHERFDYPIDKVSGSLQLTDNDWLFRDLAGRNDSAYITGEGTWLSHPGDGNHLSLTFRATDVPLADELRQALTPGAQRLWTNLRPRGNIDHLVVGMKYNATEQRLSVDVKGEKWPPGRNVEGRALSIEPTWLRYRMDGLTGSIHYHDGLMELTGLAASHGKATLEADGWARVLADGGCRLQLTRLAADRLEADHELIAALPPGIGQGLGRLAVQGPINVLGSLGVTVPGHSEVVPELDWDLAFDLEQGRLATAIPVEHIHGGVRLVGGSGPQGALSRGELTIDSAVIRGVQLTQITGPLVIDSQRVIFGAAAERDVKGRVPRPITANAFEGQLAVDGQLELTSAGEFQVEATLTSADLAAVAREISPRQKGLSGKVFGDVVMTGTLQGVHTWRGRGHVRLRDADIYELPVMIAMLNLLRVQRPDRTAFTNSHIDFRVEGDDLALDRINFDGDLLCLKGKGRITGQREVDLKFYPQFGRDEEQLPFLRPLVGEASRQFLLIEVTGTLDRQNVTQTVFPTIDQRLAELFPELVRQRDARPAVPPLLSRPREALERSGLLPRR